MICTVCGATIPHLCPRCAKERRVEAERTHAHFVTQGHLQPGDVDAALAKAKRLLMGFVEVEAERVTIVKVVSDPDGEQFRGKWWLP